MFPCISCTVYISRQAYLFVGALCPEVHIPSIHPLTVTAPGCYIHLKWIILAVSCYILFCICCMSYFVLATQTPSILCLRLRLCNQSDPRCRMTPEAPMCLSLWRQCECVHNAKQDGFLAVHNSSIGDLVTQSVTHSQYFYFCHTKSNPKDLRPLRHLISVMRRHDLTKKYLPTYIPTHLPTYLPMYLH